MRISRIRICEFKGVDVELPWASAVVLFGPNDSGKTNILEGVLSNFGADRRVRVQPSLEGRFGDGDQALVALDVELNGLRIPGHPDQAIFLQWLLTGNVEPWWQPHIEDLPSTDFLADEDEPWAELRADFERLRDGCDQPAALAALVDRTLDAFSLTRAKRLAHAGLAETLTEAQLSSPCFEVWNGMLYWVAGSSTSRTLLAEFALFRPTPGRGQFEDFLEPLDLQVVRVAASAGAQADLLDRLETALERQSMRALEAASADHDEGPFHVKTILMPNDLWVERDGESTTLRPAIGSACAALSERVNALAPPFVAGSYEVQVVPLFPDEWHAYDGRHVAVRLQPRSGLESFDLDLASSGVGTWTSFALSEALRLEEQALHTRPPDDAPAEASVPGPATTVYVFDEPETHLHPLAQEQAAAWIADRARAGANVLLASHAVPFLRLPLEDAEYLKVTRNEEWETVVQSLSHDVLGAVAGSARALGLPPVALIQLTRAWLVVEGEHDRMILEAFHGDELSRAGIRIIALRGASRAKASFLNLDALAPLGLPFFCLLDNARAESVAAGRIPETSRSDEEHIAEQLIRLELAEGVTLEVLGLPYPDVICTLPIEAVVQVARENGGRPKPVASWDEIIAAHARLRHEARTQSQKAPDFKTYVLATLGLDGWPADRLVAEALRACEGQPAPDGPLARVVARVVAGASVPT